jgi:phosphoribosylformylglycinamidine cyclo-ligase
MPGFYQAGEYDVSGTIVGVVEKTSLLDGKSIRRGDAVIGLASSGLHTNGYSLARKIFFEQMRLKPSSRVAELGNTIGDELLKVHISYGPLVQRMLKRFNSALPNRPGAGRRARPVIKGLAHITGGGFVDNIPRVLPRNCDVRVRLGSWEVPAIFRLLEEKGDVAEPELYQVFNMGIGMTIIVESGLAAAILKFIRAQGQPAWLIGEVIKGAGRVRLER